MRLREHIWWEHSKNADSKSKKKHSRSNFFAALLSPVLDGFERLLSLGTLHQQLSNLAVIESQRNWTRAGWVRSANATSAPCQPSIHGLTFYKPNALVWFIIQCPRSLFETKKLISTKFRPTFGQRYSKPMIGRNICIDLCLLWCLEIILVNGREQCHATD